MPTILCILQTCRLLSTYEGPLPLHISLCPLQQKRPPLLQMRARRLREGLSLGRSHTAHEWGGCSLNPICLLPALLLVAVLPPALRTPAFSSHTDQPGERPRSPEHKVHSNISSHCKMSLLFFKVTSGGTLPLSPQKAAVRPRMHVTQRQFFLSQ